MFEVEVKLETNHDPVRTRLEELNADRLGSVEQSDTYYNAPDRDFEKTDEALRIRRENPMDAPPVSRVAYKGPLVDPDSKTREEAETTIADAEEMAEILEGLGYEPAAVVDKCRECYTYEDLFVTLDDVSDLGEFVEVETETTADIDDARDRIFDLLHVLNLDPTDQIRTSYLSLLLENHQ